METRFNLIGRKNHYTEADETDRECVLFAFITFVSFSIGFSFGKGHCDLSANDLLQIESSQSMGIISLMQIEKTFN